MIWEKKVIQSGESSIRDFFSLTAPADLGRGGCEVEQCSNSTGDLGRQSCSLMMDKVGEP